MKFLKALEFNEIFEIFENLEIWKCEIFEIVQYTYSVQKQGYIARFFSIEINRKIFITIYYILSSNKGICVWPIWPEVNCPYFHTLGR